MSIGGLNAEDLSFLKTLCEEVKTQDNRGTAKPVLWLIVYQKHKGFQKFLHRYDGFFLTEKAASEHLQKYPYRYHDRAEVYADHMPDNYEIKTLVEILGKMTFDCEGDVSK